MRLAINGFGRIGRSFFRQAFNNSEIEIVAINDLGDIKNLAYLLRRDTIYGEYEKTVDVRSNQLVVDSHNIFVFSEKDPAKLPWQDLNIDIVVESTGVFNTSEKAKAHLDAGAKRVVITSPADANTPHILAGSNNDKLTRELNRITSDASCTTNAVVPVLDILQVNPGIRKAMLNTAHAYTASQSLVDGPGGGKDFLRGRAAAQNIVPSHTGAADAVIRSQPWLKDIFEAIAVRVPVIVGSLADLTFVAGRRTTVEEINDILRKAAKQPKWQGIFTVSEEPLVSSDIIKNPHASIADLTHTKVVGGDMVKVLAWYDNEWGYCGSLIKHILNLKGLL
ncbi:MAG: glyceraldehyde 3-phosphate dehydrogenase NAD-binding domain-containing protein [bacterium]|nr:glyceraldehyde 3-phosphate dehydrogenase NAD-binding domain-containing protein [bacterium]